MTVILYLLGNKFNLIDIEKTKLSFITTLGIIAKTDEFRGMSGIFCVNLPAFLFETPTCTWKISQSAYKKTSI